MLRRELVRHHTRGPLQSKGWLLCSMLVMAAGCKGVLDVKTPDIVQPSALTSAAGLEAIRVGAFGDFAKAYGGDATASDAQETQILATGLFTDEFANAETDPERIAYDSRHIDPTGAGGHLGNFYSVLHRARHAAEAAAATFTNAAPSDEDVVVAEMMSLAGFTYAFFAEDYCSGVPLSTVTDAGDVEYGESTTTQDLLQLSVARFDTAIARAQKAGNTTVEYLARVGQGRALVDLGQFPEAAAAVASVPTSFRYNIMYSTNSKREQNAVFYAINTLKRWSMANNKGINGIDYRDAYTNGDPRTPWTPAPGDGLGFDKAAGPVYFQQLYPSFSAPIPLATGAEARLIEAEAALNAENIPVFESIHNQLRATLNAPAVGPISASTMTAAQRIDFHFRERALWLYATGHRLGDMRRLIRQYGRTQDQVFPTGAYYRPQYPTYGTDVNFPVAFDEQNNPNFQGCIDRNA